MFEQFLLDAYRIYIYIYMDQLIDNSLFYGINILERCKGNGI